MEDLRTSIRHLIKETLPHYVNEDKIHFSRKNKPLKIYRRLNDLFQNNQEFRKILGEDNPQSHLLEYVHNNFSDIPDLLLEEENPEEVSPIIQQLQNIGLQQLPLIYNKVFRNYFNWIKLKFTISDSHCLKLVKAYSNFTQLINKTSTKGQAADVLQNYQTLREATNFLLKAITTLTGKLNVEEVQLQTNAETIGQLLQANGEVVSQLIAITFSPLENGYIAALGGLAAQTNNTKISSSPDFVNLDDYTKEANDALTQQQGVVINEYFNKAQNSLAGTWMKSRMENSMKDIKSIIEKIPPTTITKDNSNNIIRQFISKTENAIKNPNQGSLAAFARSYSNAFTEISENFSAYTKELTKFLDTIHLTKETNPRTLASHINRNDPGFFNLHTNRIATLALNGTAQTQIPQQQKFDLVDKLGLGTLPPPTKQFANLIVSSLNLTKKNNNGEPTQTDIQGDTLRNAIQGNGSLTDLIQDWAATVDGAKLILWAADKYSLENLVESIKSHLTKKPQNSSYGSLLDAIQNKEFNGGRNKGHDLNWKPNQQTDEVLFDLSEDNFFDNLNKLSPEDWKNIFFNEDFLKNKLFSASKDGNVVNQNDVENAEAIENADEENTNTTTNTQFATNLKRLVATTNIPNESKFASFQIAIGRGAENSINNLSAEQVLTIGKTLNTFILTFFRKFNGKNIDRNNVQALAKNFASDLLRANNAIPNKDDVDNLYNALIGNQSSVLVAFNPKNYDATEKKVNSDKGKIIRDNLGIVLEAINDNL